MWATARQVTDIKLGTKALSVQVFSSSMVEMNPFEPNSQPAEKTSAYYKSHGSSSSEKAIMGRLGASASSDIQETGGLVLTVSRKMAAIESWAKI